MQPVPRSDSRDFSGSRRPLEIRIHRDSRAWQLQVWISFLLAFALCAVGLAWLPGRDLDRAFMVMGYIFCLSAAFVLSKYVRDRQQESYGELGEDEGSRHLHPLPATANTPLFGIIVWGGFSLAMALTAWGLWRMEINPTWKAYLGVCWLYLISGAFTLAKMVRDRHEADVADTLAASRAAVVYSAADPA